MTIIRVFIVQQFLQAPRQQRVRGGQIDCGFAQVWTRTCGIHQHHGLLERRARRHGRLIKKLNQ
ncbi:hypothetical protein AW736_05775 [Termitidicoccus mucosus]|uniref:Uncharacterized protein n=1 Tax=Termitidicoccus mucosus TaxID=1184151 RepID=A0A178INH5_9BACT|nr:hypothetical protein AW736_05775 [Opitutaceae bacterium TSB47]